MNTLDFILVCLQCYKGACIYIDELEKNFNVEQTQEDILEAVKETASKLLLIENQERKDLQLGNALIARMFDMIINKAKLEYPKYAKDFQNQFQYYAEDSASSLIFNGIQVKDWDELEQEIRIWINEQEKTGTVRISITAENAIAMYGKMEDCLKIQNYLKFDGNIYINDRLAYWKDE